MICLEPPSPLGFSSEDQSELDVREGPDAHILLVGENRDVIPMLQAFTVPHGSLKVVENTEAAIEDLKHGKYNAIVLDLLYSGFDAASFCHRLCNEHPRVPVLMLVSLRTLGACVPHVDSRLRDYVVAPFSAQDLWARLTILFSRTDSTLPSSLTIGDVTLHLTTRVVQRAAHMIQLTQRESALLEYLMRNVGHCVSRSMIERHVWGVMAQTNIVAVYINYLRRKLDGGFSYKLIRTRWGIGYEFNTD